jgi:hypothetical protein
MSDDLLVREAARRRAVFNNLEEYLEKVRAAVKELDPAAEAYLFGSVAEGTHTYSSDIDILVITRRKPAEVIKHLWEAGIGDPFEIHVEPPERLEGYRQQGKLIRL